MRAPHRWSKEVDERRVTEQPLLQVAIGRRIGHVGIRGGKGHDVCA